MSKQRFGLGFDKGKLVNRRTFDLFKDFLKHIRRTGCAPLLWHRSLGCALDKGGRATGCKGKRVVHLPEPFDKAFYAGRMQKGPLPRMPLTDHGYEVAKRREFDILVQFAMSWRLLRGGFARVGMLYDLSNASGCTSHAALGGAVDEILDEREAKVGRQRHEWASVTFAERDGAKLMWPNDGGFMGDPFVVRAFAHSFKHTMRRWQGERGEWDEMRGMAWRGVHPPARRWTLP